MTTEERQEILDKIENLKEEVENLENGDNEKEYIEYLNDSQESYKIGYLEFFAGDILKNCDEVAFRCSLNDYNDSRITDINDEIENLQEELSEIEE
jgi:hypothetical protein